MDVFILIYLSVKIYFKAKESFLKPWHWVFRLVSLFVTTELIIGLIILNYFGMEKIMYAVIPSLLTACISAFFVFKQLNTIIAFSEENDSNDEEDEDERRKANLDHFR